MFRWLFRNPPPPTAEELYFERMKALHWLRGGILVCTGSDNPKLPHHFNPPVGDDLTAAFRGHLERLWPQWLAETVEMHFCTTAVVAAGLLSYGELPMAAYILDHLPDQDFSKGFCHFIARDAVVALLPLPVELRNSRAWIAGSPEAEAVRSWLARHESRLMWQPSSGTFVLSESDGVNA